MFKLDGNADNFDRIKSAASTKSSNSVTPETNGCGQKYSVNTKRNKVAATKFMLQDILGKKIVPITTAVLLVLYFITVIVQC